MSLQQAVERDDDVLTAEEMKTHLEEVNAAMLKELNTQQQSITECVSARLPTGKLVQR